MLVVHRFTSRDRFIPRLETHKQAYSDLVAGRRLTLRQVAGVRCKCRGAKQCEGSQGAGWRAAGTVSTALWSCDPGHRRDWTGCLRALLADAGALWSIGNDLTVVPPQCLSTIVTLVGA